MINKKNVLTLLVKDRRVLEYFRKYEVEPQGTFHKYLGGAVTMKACIYAESFNIIIKVPTYDDSGNVVDFEKEYANIILMPDKVDIEKRRRENVSILSLAECNIPVKDLFKVFPK